MTDQTQTTETFIVTLVHLGNPFFLRNTIWTADRDRASEFASKDAATAQLVKAKPFMKATQFKGAVIRRA